MRRLRSVRGIVVLTVASLCACGPTDDGSVSRLDADPRCIEVFEPGVDYYPVKTEVRHARNFSLTYHEHYAVLRSRMPATNWGPEVSDVVVLNRCGTPAPALEGELAGAIVLETPVERFATNSLASALRLRVLGLTDRIVGMPSNPYDSLLVERIRGGEVVTVAGRGAPDFEPLLVQGAETLVQFTSSLEHATTVSEARDLGIGALPLLSWAEPTYLGQAEWIKHHAALFGAEGDAERFFADVETRYDSLAALVADAAPVDVLWATPTGPDRWWVEVGNWQDEVLTAAGGRNVVEARPEESSIVLEEERIIEVAPRIGVWIANTPDPGAMGGAPVIRALVEATERTWHVHGRVDASRDAADWNETPLVRPDLILEDLIAVLHPALLPAHDPRFLEAIATGADDPTGRR